MDLTAALRQERELKMDRALSLTTELRPLAIAGLKTQTRTPIKFPDGCDEFSIDYDKGIIAFGHDDFTEGLLQLEDAEYCRKIPYQVGDRLYLQEPYQIASCDKEYWILNGLYLADLKVFSTEMTLREIKLWQARKFPYRGTSGRFMYESLARYRFEVTGVGAEQVQDIKPRDCKAEGIFVPRCGLRRRRHVEAKKNKAYRRYFHELWDSIYGSGKYSWEKNPWIWKRTFRKV